MNKRVCQIHRRVIVAVALVLCFGIAATRRVACAPPDSAIATGTDGSPEKWVEVRPFDVAELFQMLASQTRGNYERIRTWRGSYLCRMRRGVSAAEAADLKAESAGQALRQEIRYRLDLVVDNATNQTYKATTQSTLTWLNAVSGRRVQIPNTSVRD